MVFLGTNLPQLRARKEESNKKTRITKTKRSKSVEFHHERDHLTVIHRHCKEIQLNQLSHEKNHFVKYHKGASSRCRGFPVQRCIVLKHLSKEAEETAPGSQSPPTKRPCPDLQVKTSPVLLFPCTQSQYDI